ncbi:hypothetical protein NESM_000328800 [Novymonas esmeraldas]|uniref:EF-hand domain-containing protein n=1 Tax=Novymonas esmeraldas TaxID=1808958 RepID=A0AAW0EL52_9TRYP
MAGIESPSKPFGNRGSVDGAAVVSDALRPPSAMAGVKRGYTVVNRNLSFAVADDSDPLALLYSAPPNEPPSLARRAFGTETLFHYYAARGYKEVVSETTTADAAKAVQACLEGGAAAAATAVAAAGSGMAAVAAQHRHERGGQQSTKSGARPYNMHTIDRCLVSTAAAAAAAAAQPVAAAANGAVAGAVPLYTPLRPAQAYDNGSTYRTQRADERRAAVEQERRERLRQTPEAALYLGRYYPESSQVVVDVQQQLAEPGAAAAGGAGAAKSQTRGSSTSTSNIAAAAATTAAGAPSPSRSPVLQSIAPLPLTPASPNGHRTFSNTGTGRRHSQSRKTNSLSAPSIAPQLLRTPQEVTAMLQQQQENRRAIADQVEDAFVDAYHLRDPTAAQRQRDRASAVAQRQSMQAAAALLANGGAAAAAKQRASSAKKMGGKKKKSTAAPAAPPKREGGVPSNLDAFRTSLLQACNEDGAVSLDQLRALLANVPFHIGTLAHASSHASDSASAVQRLFHAIHATTRAPNATDATDLLLAVASATSGGGGGASSRQLNAAADNSISAAHGGQGSSFSRASNASGARRGPGTSTSLMAAGAAKLQQQPSVSVQLRASHASVMSTNTASMAGGGATLAGGQSPSATSFSLGAGPTAGDAAASGTAGGNRQAAHATYLLPADLRDGRKCVLVVEVLDALHTLLNSSETRQIVRWECFNVLAAEGNGYIHKSQLAQLRRHAYRDGSAAEEQAAVTAAMVKALGDVFSMIAVDEEAAYIKANKKGKKRGGATVLAAHQSSPIPLHMMRTSHIDHATFSRFFDELPLMAAAFAHVWLPLLLCGRRHGASGPADPGKSTSTLPPPSSSITGPVPPHASVIGVPSEPEESGDADVASPARRRPASSQLLRRAAAAAATTDDSDANTFPLELLGRSCEARQAAVQRLVAERQELLHQACDAAEKEKLLSMQTEGTGNGSAFVESQSSAIPS